MPDGPSVHTSSLRNEKTFLGEAQLTSGSLVRLFRHAVAVGVAILVPLFLEQLLHQVISPLYVFLIQQMRLPLFLHMELTHSLSRFLSTIVGLGLASLLQPSHRWFPIAVLAFFFLFADSSRMVSFVPIDYYPFSPYVSFRWGRLAWVFGLFVATISGSLIGLWTGSVLKYRLARQS